MWYQNISMNLEYIFEVFLKIHNLILFFRVKRCCIFKSVLLSRNKLLFKWYITIYDQNMALSELDDLLNDLEKTVEEERGLGTVI